jgi:hypothetical protein
MKHNWPENLKTEKLFTYGLEEILGQAVETLVTGTATRGFAETFSCNIQRNCPSSQALQFRPFEYFDLYPGKPMNTLLLLSSAVLSFGGVLSAGTILVLVPSSEGVTGGQTVNVAIDIFGLGNPPSVGAFDLSVAFNPSLLAPAATPVTFGPYLGDPGITALAAFTLSPGAVEFAEVSLLDSPSLDSLQATQNGNFALGTLSFRALNSGTATFAFTTGVVDDAFGNKLVAIPEPIMTVPLGSALLAMAALAERKRLRAWVRSRVPNVNKDSGISLLTNSQLGVLQTPSCRLPFVAHIGLLGGGEP